MGKSTKTKDRERSRKVKDKKVKRKRSSSSSESTACSLAGELKASAAAFGLSLVSLNFHPSQKLTQPSRANKSWVTIAEEASGPEIQWPCLQALRPVASCSGHGTRSTDPIFDRECSHEDGWESVGGELGLFSCHVEPQCHAVFSCFLPTSS